MGNNRGRRGGRKDRIEVEGRGSCAAVFTTLAAFLTKGERESRTIPVFVVVVVGLHPLFSPFDGSRAGVALAAR